MQHDKYENDILYQLTRIADALEKIERKCPDVSDLHLGRGALGNAIFLVKDKEKK